MLDLNEIYFEGRLKEIEQIKKDIPRWAKNFEGNIQVQCFSHLKKVIISKGSAEENNYNIELYQNIKAKISPEFLSFEYNERKYYIPSAGEIKDKRLENILRD